MKFARSQRGLVRAVISFHSARGPGWTAARDARELVQKFKELIQKAEKRIQRNRP